MRSTSRRSRSSPRRIAARASPPGGSPLRWRGNLARASLVQRTAKDQPIVLYPERYRRAMLRVGMRGPMLIVYGLLALYALEIVVPLRALAIAFVTRSTRRGLANRSA